MIRLVYAMNQEDMDWKLNLPVIIGAKLTYSFLCYKVLFMPVFLINVDKKLSAG